MRVCERERETERETDRQTERDTETFVLCDAKVVLKEAFRKHSVFRSLSSNVYVWENCPENCPENCTTS